MINEIIQWFVIALLWQVLWSHKQAIKIILDQTKADAGMLEDE